jgi:4-hydroxythreonine-4-phosphate dehydrogenase
LQQLICHRIFATKPEIEEIIPAVRWAQGQGYPVEGPFPPDTLFYLAVRRKKFDAVVCMYHDSVDHGTAFDIAGKGVASTHSLIKAMQFAQKLVIGDNAAILLFPTQRRARFS